MNAPQDDKPALAVVHRVRMLLPVRRAVWLWADADGARMSAAMSFYGILSLAPLLVLLVAGLGWWLDRDSLQQGLIAQIGTIVGEQGAAVIRQALSSAQEPSQGLLASLLGFLVLLFGATGVFGELQSALQRLWTHGHDEVPPLPWWHGASLRLRGVARAAQRRRQHGHVGRAVGGHRLPVQHRRDLLLRG